MRDDAARTIQRSQYRVPDFLVDEVALTFAIDPDRTTVTARLALRRNGAAEAPDAPLTLHGAGLETRRVVLEAPAGRRELPLESLEFGEESLVLRDVPDAFALSTEVLIEPSANTALEGLYTSGPFLLTQCEPEGFRKITWMLDRPDVMARYRVRIEGDAARFPVLLSNGNCVETGGLPDGRHFAVWEDPFRKPSYLFALVAGDLECLEDHFATAEGRRVTLRIFAEAENMDALDYAMESLKRAMAWDEQRFGLVYDLDIYNIVATNDFNMGAMENKSLNIFNSKYVLARPETATDHDFQGIEGVIAHEYFHNWTGNRVTCRDWFQLSLKEGLTVFRDQEFSADQQSRAVKRIEDVRLLRSLQFAEDAGPMAHPVRPDSYVEINNFYTLTVYEKGAEVVRMYRTLLGEAGFQRGMKLYFERHDGQAVTCEDFLRAMADANGVDLEQFGRWYAQAGTPEVTAEGSWDARARRYTLTLRQRTPETPGGDERRPLHIPVALGLLGADGADLPLRCANASLGGEGDVVELTEREQQFVFEGVGEKPVPSLLRRFSAPVKLSYGYDRDELAFLMANDRDSFNRWDAAQRLATDVVLEQARRPAEDPGRPVDGRLVAAAAALVRDRAADPALVAEALQLPGLDYLCQQLDVMDVPAVYAARRRTVHAIARGCGTLLVERYGELTVPGPYRPEPRAMARRSLRSTLLAIHAVGDPLAAAGLAGEQFDAADNMTERLGALQVLLHEDLPGGEAALERFHARFSSDPLVMDKWFAVQATIPRPDTLLRVQELLGHPAFSLKNPNKVRALLGAFTRNLPAFHAVDGGGYAFLAEQILALDALNPQVAARLVGAFNHWKRLPEAPRERARGQLVRIRSRKGLSPDVGEIVGKALVD